MSNSTGNTILAILTGTAIGAGIGILFAPQKGTVTRKKIKDTLDKSKDNVLEKINVLVSDVKSKMEPMVRNLEVEVEELVSKGSFKTEEVIEVLEQKLTLLKKENAKFQK
jgi:gas vesicle protein